LLAKGEDDARVSTCRRSGIAEFYDDQHRVLRSVQPHEECLHWNSNIKGSGQINDKWMKEIVFFGMIIIPAYQLSALLGMFIFNSMHFWTGESPIKASSIGGDGTNVITLGETTIWWTPSEDGATVIYEHDGVVKRHATIVSSATGYRLVDENGGLLSEAEYGPDGSVRFLNEDCRLIKQLNRKELRSIAEAEENHKTLDDGARKS
jgi:hypothetical protein